MATVVMAMVVAVVVVPMLAARHRGHRRGPRAGAQGAERIVVTVGVPALMMGMVVTLAAIEREEISRQTVTLALIALLTPATAWQKGVVSPRTSGATTLCGKGLAWLRTRDAARPCPSWCPWSSLCGPR